MSESQDRKSYLDIGELVAHSGLSKATIWRLKRDGKIAFFQPGGKGGRVMFPANALELAGRSIEKDFPDTGDSEINKNKQHKYGPSPLWKGRR